MDSGLVAQVLQCWGFGIHTFTHGCPCPEHQDPDLKLDKPCKMNGRRMIEFASGACSGFLNDLKNLSIQGDSKAAEAVQNLARIDSAAAQTISNSFEAAKAAMMLRFRQGSAFYEQFPWNLPKLLKFVVVPSTDRTDAIQSSRDFARELLSSYHAKTLPTGTFADFLFSDQDLRAALGSWSSGSDEHMQTGLFTEVLAYGVCLVPMQRLESRHHLVHQKASPARAATVAYHSANLRRTLNKDVHQPTFQAELDEYLQGFNELVSEPWSTRSELAKLTSGHNLSIMFADVTWEQTLIAQTTPPTRSRIDHALTYQEHLKMAIVPGGHYALPVTVDFDGSTTYCLCRVIDIKPAAKKYMERAVQWSHDTWNDHLGVLMMGTHVVQKEEQDVPVMDLEADLTPAPLAANFSFEVKACTMERMPLEAFFKFDFENVYRLEDIKYTCELSMDAINTAVDEDGLYDTADEGVLQLGLCYESVNNADYSC